jgi:hypothetical protein
MTRCKKALILLILRRMRVESQNRIVGAHTEAQALANASSMKVTIPQAFWAELKRQNLIEQNAPVPEGGA